jgi:hypothetical protein
VVLGVSAKEARAVAEQVCRHISHQRMGGLAEHPMKIAEI